MWWMGARRYSNEQRHEFPWNFRIDDAHVDHCSVVMLHMLVRHNGSFLVLDMDNFLTALQSMATESLAAKAPK